MKTKKYVITALVIASLAITTISAIASANSTQSNTSDQTKDFLSNVLGLDLTKYSYTLTPQQSKYNDTKTTQIPDYIHTPNEDRGYKVEGPLYRFVYDNNTLDVVSTFYNEQLVVVNLYKIDNNASYIYANKPGNNLWEQASTLLTRYSEFMSQKSGADTSVLIEMKNILNSINAELSTANTTVGNINFQVSKNENDVTRLQWIYVGYDTIMDVKRVEMIFNDDDLRTFRDTWSIYKVDGPNVLSAEQAREIALDAAHNLPLNVSTSDGKVETVKTPDLSNASYDMRFNMEPCEGPVAKEMSLEPLTLYPVWHFTFYFDKMIAGVEGIQVGILGDTGAIYFTTIYGHLGIPSIATNTPNSDANNPLGFSTIFVVALLLILIVSIPVVLYHKIHRRG